MAEDHVVGLNRHRRRHYGHRRGAADSPDSAPHGGSHRDHGSIRAARSGCLARRGGASAAASNQHWRRWSRHREGRPRRRALLLQRPRLVRRRRLTGSSLQRRRLGKLLLQGCRFLQAPRHLLLRLLPSHLVHGTLTLHLLVPGHPFARSRLLGRFLHRAGAVSPPPALRQRGPRLRLSGPAPPELGQLHLRLGQLPLNGLLCSQGFLEAAAEVRLPLLPCSLDVGGVHVPSA
mmetsp:Transcript_97153/g.299433  ORF Transcript_97153/g.299433 Transcript_97153/m.299433 type:complete len:233 (+) Transcript_97153:127-825(+)